MQEEAMVLKQLRTVRNGEEEDLMPVSPTGQYFNSSVLSVTVLNIFESEIPIHDSQTLLLLQRDLLPINPRFSSIMVKDEQGVMHWKKVKVNVEDHVAVAVFPAGLSPEDYEEHVQEYLSKIAMEPLPQNRPLWDLHLIKYPTTNAAGMLVFKLHHAIGDGFSLMAALFSYVKRADDPSLPFTFPSSSSSSSGEFKPEMSIYSRVCGCVSLLWSTAADFGFSVLKSNWLKDDRTPIRSAVDGVEFRPITISSVIFSLDRIRQIKSKLGGTVNDVICGIIFYGTQLYMQKDGKTARDARATALVLLNTRIISGYKSLEEMTKADAESPWGNNFGFMHVPVPSCDTDTADPLEFIVKARQTIKQKRSSLGVVLTGRLLEMLRKFRGREEAAKYIHATLRNTSMTISNMVGPMEKLVMADHPTKSFYFMVVGVPQSLTITMVSYMGNLRVAVGTEKGFINSQLLISCFERAFNRIFEAAIGKDKVQLN